MTTVQHVISLMEQLAPRSYAESWDNVGLMVGDRNAVVTGVLTTLDVTEEAIAYAIEHNYNLIVSHHPLIFKGLKQLSCDTVQGRMINQLIQHKIAVYSAHTNLDIAPGGLNDMLANQLGLIDIKGFVKTGEEVLYKVTTFVPESSADAVRHAMGAAGAGKIGNYEHCSFSLHGEGRFIASPQQVLEFNKTGQIATQYVDFDGIASMDSRFNPNQSVAAIEGIYSPDGRVFGKMAHSERCGAGISKNIPGQLEMPIFTSGVKYFK